MLRYLSSYLCFTRMSSTVHFNFSLFHTELSRFIHHEPTWILKTNFTDSIFYTLIPRLHEIKLAPFNQSCQQLQHYMHLKRTMSDFTRKAFCLSLKHRIFNNSRGQFLFSCKYVTCLKQLDTTHYYTVPGSKLQMNNSCFSINGFHSNFFTVVVGVISSST